MHEYNVADLMTKKVITATPDTTLREVVKRLHTERFSCMVIVNEEGPIGMITERDMVIILADLYEDDAWVDMPVENFMSSPVVSVGEDLTLFEAVDVSRANSIRHIPVVDDNGQLVGLLTQSDIVNGYYNSSVGI